MKNSCPLVQSKFRKSVNMTPAAILAWAKNPKARLASFESTRRRLPALAALRAKRASDWTDKDCRFANRVISFNARMAGAARRDGCTVKEDVSLRNWGRKEPSCRGRGISK